MNRKVYWILLAVVFLALSLITGCGSSSSTPPAKVVTVAATTGSSQSATVGAAFANALVATVTTGGTPTAGVTVTFTAPASGASGTFAGGANTATTNSSGVATSAVFTANTTAGSYMVTASSSGATTPASFSLTNTAGPAATIAATSGSGQSATISTAFANPLAATVEDSDSNPVSGVTVTFTAPASGASGTFADSHNNVTTATTNSSGVATSAVFTANATTGGPYNVSAAATGVAAPVNFSLTNSAVVVGTSTNYSFYLSGADNLPAGSGYNFLALAGAVTINADGSVAGGVQDYNDAFGVTSPQPAGDKITGGKLTVSGTTGQGTLTLITNNTKVGVSGTETFGVQFVNAKHALIMQFDGTATSSGSMDVQTLPSTPSGGFAITLSGVNSKYLQTAIGGVFTITGTSLAGTIDENDDGSVATNQAFAGTLTAADAMGRGTLSITGGGSLINYYIVGPEVVRIIDVDTTKVSIGSAFGQGSGSFNNASLGTSVFAIAGNPWVAGVGAVGQFSTSNTSNATADVSGVGDDNDLLNGKSATALAITGTYSIASDGYGSMTITSGLGGDISALGVYMTDPTLNLNDPNNSSSGGGGALVLDLDSGSGTAPDQAGTTGIISPQTDPTATNFTGAYAVGVQDFNILNASCGTCEFDMIAQGTMTSGSFSLTGMVSDPFTTLTSATTSSGDTFTGTPPPDGSNPGRYSNFGVFGTIDGQSGSFGAVMYQASGKQLYWLDVDVGRGVWVGPLEQQGSLTGIPSVQKPTTKPQLKHKD